MPQTSSNIFRFMYWPYLFKAIYTTMFLFVWCFCLCSATHETPAVPCWPPPTFQIITLSSGSFFLWIFTTWVVGEYQFTHNSGWWLHFFLIFTPIWGRFPFWLIFSKGLKPPTRIAHYIHRANYKTSWLNRLLPILIISHQAECAW